MLVTGVKGGTDMGLAIIDTPHSTADLAPALAAAGVQCVIRYYNRQNTARFPHKKLTAAEADILSGSGISLAVVFQQNNRDLEDFGAANGATDAARALSDATAVGQPAGSAIYFAVDSDFLRPSELQAIGDYFAAVHAAFAQAPTSYRIGVYGSGTVAQALLDAGLVDLVWLAAALGWSGSRKFLESGRWDIFQDKISLKFQTIDYDSNITRSGVTDFGQFRTTPPAAHVALQQTPREISASPSLFEVTARTSLNLRGGPGLEFGVIRSLSSGQHLYGLKRSGEWLQVDVEGDGVADGYVHAGYLRPLVGAMEDLTASGTQPIDIANRELERHVHEIPGAAVNPRIALYYQNLDRVVHQDDEVPWCSYFVNYCFAAAGRRGSGRANARSWLGWGRPVPSPEQWQRGDIAVFWRGDPAGAQGHVGFLIGWQGDDPIILGGNQGDAVSVTPKDGSRLLGIRRG